MNHNDVQGRIQEEQRAQLVCSDESFRRKIVPKRVNASSQTRYLDSVYPTYPANRATPANT